MRLIWCQSINQESVAGVADRFSVCVIMHFTALDIFFGNIGGNGFCIGNHVATSRNEIWPVYQLGSAEKRRFLGIFLLECLSVADVAAAMVCFFYLFSRV